MWLISGARRPPPLRRHAVPSAERDQNWWKRTENEDIMRIWWLFHVEIYGDILQYFWFDMICNGTSMYPLVLQRTDYRSIQISTCSGLVSALYTMLWGGIRRKIRNSWYIQLSMPNWWQDKGILIDHIDHRSCSRFSWCSADMCSQCCQLWHLQKHRETWTCVPGRRGIALAILAEDFPSHTACLDLGTFTSLLVWGLVPGSLSTRRGSLRFPLDSSREWHFCTDSYM